ncbi:MAG: purine-nucleoside phosphorylase [Anaerolineae bacterium]|nr:purine-nucleoside phosphorylase [Anaerolineae bacterium]
MTPELPISQAIAEAAQAVRRRSQVTPAIAIITGSGLGPLADEVEAAITIPYRDIPHFPESTVAGHSGALVLGHIAGQTVVVMRGRLHFYEGYPPQAVTFPVRVMHALGARTLFVTNAAGGINPGFQVGDLMLIRDHLFLPGMAGWHPLRGPNDDTLGPRFPSTLGAYDQGLRDLARQKAAEQGLTLREGVYAMVAGPSFETPAEIRFLRLAGADAVGMSTAPEVIVARHAGLRVLGMSLITNIASDDSDAAPLLGEAGHLEVLEAAQAAVPRLTRLARAMIEGIGSTE